MKKFFKFGKDKKKTLTPQPSPTLSTRSKASKASSAGITSCGYVVKEKDLGKLHKAVWHNEFEKVAQLSKKDASPFDKEHRTPLHFACALGYVDIATQLLEWKAKVNVCDNMNRTPLLKAAECCQDEMVKLLLDNKADPNAKDKHEETCLHYAVENEQHNMLRILLASPKIFVDIKNQEGRTPLHIAAKKKNQKLCEILLNGGADIDTQDGRGMTVLMDCCSDGAPEMVKYFVQNRADVSKKNEKGWTAEDICQIERQEACSAILNQGSGRPQKQAGGQKPGTKDNGMYGLPAEDDEEEEDYSETDGVMSKISEAAGGVESWAETDDDSELHPPQTNTKKIPPNLKTIMQGKDDSWEESDDETPPIPSSPPPNQEPSNVPSPSPKVENGMEPQEDDENSWGDSEEEVEDHSPNVPKGFADTDIKAQSVALKSEVNKSDAQADNIDSWAESEDESILIPKNTAVSSSATQQKVINEAVDSWGESDDDSEPLPKAKTVQSPAQTQAKANVLDSWAESDDEIENAVKQSSQAHVVATKAKPLDSWAESDEDSDVSPRGTLVTTPAHDQAKSKVLDSWAESDEETHILASPAVQAQNNMTTKSVTSTKVAQQKTGSTVNDLGISDVESISDPEFEDDGNQSNVKPAPASNDAANDSDWDSTVASELSPRHPVMLSARSMNDAEVIEEEVDSPEATAQPGFKPDGSADAPAVQHNNLSVGASVIDNNASITHVHNNLNTPKIENTALRQGVHDFDESDFDDDDENDDDGDDDIPDIPTVPKEFQDPDLKQVQEDIPSASAVTQRKEIVTIETTTVTVTESPVQQADTNSIDFTDGPAAQTIVTQEHSAPEKTIENTSFGDLDDINVEMGSVKKLSDVPGALGLTGLKSSNAYKDKDDDCLSYSSTEYEPSVHDEVRPHTFSLPPSTDATSSVRLHQQLREYQHRLEKERSARTSYESKCKSFENERLELAQKVETLSKVKSQLEQEKIEMDSKIRNFEFQNIEETEKRKNAEMMYSKVKEQLLRKEEQFTEEVESKQKCELSLRNLQMEIHTLQSAVKQSDEDKDDLQRQLNHERNTRLLQEQINEEQSKLQHSFTEDLNKSGSLAEAISHKDGEDSQRLSVDTAEKLKAELYAAKMDLERARTRSKDDIEILTLENEELHQKIEELKGDIKLNDEALAHASLQYNVEITTLKADNTKLVADVETSKSTKEKLESEITSLKNRLEMVTAELEKSQGARSALEKQGHSQQDDLSRQLERRDQDLSHIKENNQVLIQRLNDADSKLNKMESELQVTNTSLIERNNQLANLQRELDQKKVNHEKLDENYRQAKEDNARLQVKVESSQERVSFLQQENMAIKKQLDESQIRFAGEGRDESDKFTIILSSLREDHEKQRTKLEEHNSSLNQNISHQREEIHNLRNQKQTQEQQIVRLQDQLSDASRSQAMSEASIAIANKSKEQLESEIMQHKNKVDNLKSKLDTAREKQVEAQMKINELSDRAEKAEKQHTEVSQQLMNQSGTLQAASNNKTEMGDNLRKLEIENAKMEASLKHESQKVAMLQRELDDSQKVRATLEGMLSTVKTTHIEMTHKVAEATATRTLATQEAEDSQTLWENEVKSRSKLGLRIAQLEREKQSLSSQLDEERRLNRKNMDQKKKIDSKLESEKNSASHLQKEVTLLKTHLRAAKKRLKELDTGDHVVNAIRADFSHERLEMEHNLSSLRKQLDNATNQLQSEVEIREQIETKSRQLEVELSTLKSIEKAYAKLEKSKRKLEEDLNQYRSHINMNLVERGDVEKLKAEIEARSRVELNRKLEEVNKYLEEQALARGKLDQMRDDNESDMKKDFESTRKELLEELASLRTSYKTVLDQHDSKTSEVKRYKRMCESEQKKREQLTERLQKASNTASNAAAMTVMDRNPLSSSLPFESTWSQGLTKSDLGDALGDRLKQELNRSIAKHMEKVPGLNSTAPLRSYDDSFIPTSLKSTKDAFL